MSITNEEVEHLMQVLLEKKLELRRRAGAIRRDVAAGRDNDLAGQAAELENADVLNELSREAIEELGRINLALARMAAGTYGSCERCGKQIRPERLRSVPYAIRCLQCEAALELQERRE